MSDKPPKVPIYNVAGEFVGYMSGSAPPRVVSPDETRRVLDEVRFVLDEREVRVYIEQGFCPWCGPGVHLEPPPRPGCSLCLRRRGCKSSEGEHTVVCCQCRAYLEFIATGPEGLEDDQLGVDLNRLTLPGKGH